MRTKLASAALAAAVTMLTMAAAPASGHSLAAHHVTVPTGKFGGLPIPSGPHHATVPALSGIPTAYTQNWSGYVQAGQTGQFEGVYDQWFVPKVNTKLAGVQEAVDWIGIDGYNLSDLIQEGTAEENIDGKAVYFAWTEMLPANYVVFTNMTIHPGDKISAELEGSPTNAWYMRVTDVTTGQDGIRNVNYTTPMQTAEVVHERPTTRGKLEPLAQTNKALFGSAEVYLPAVGNWTDFGRSYPGATLTRIIMQRGTNTIAVPSAIRDASGTGAFGACFDVADGTTAPPAPSATACESTN
jgi:hypothetical protein